MNESLPYTVRLGIDPIGRMRPSKSTAESEIAAEPELIVKREAILPRSEVERDGLGSGIDGVVAASRANGIGPRRRLST